MTGRWTTRRDMVPSWVTQVGVSDDARASGGERFQLEGHLCEDCAIELSKRLGIYPGQEQEQA